MPELPEVQTVVNGIKSKIINLKVLRFQKYTNKLRYPIQRDLASQIEGHNVTIIDNLINGNKKLVPKKAKLF